MIYFIHGDLIAEHGEARVYLYNGLLHLEIGPGHNLWMVESEIKELVEQIGDSPCGKCLEIGLGLGVASKYILSCPKVESLTTVEIDPDVIAVQKKANGINDSRHTIVHAGGLDFIILADEKYDFIFLDYYSIIDEDTLEILDAYVKAARKTLADGGTILGWFDPYTPKEHADKFFDIIKRPVILAGQ